MNGTDWQRLNTAFETAADLATDARARYLDALSRQDAALARELARLLAAERLPDDALLPELRQIAAVISGLGGFLSHVGPASTKTGQLYSPCRRSNAGCKVRRRSR